MTPGVVGERPVIVVGAGLAGLACATALDRAGVPVRVLEAGDAVGGRVRTDLVAGFRLDRGFQVLLTAYPEAHRQLDLDALELRRFEPGARVQTGPSSSVVADPFRSPRRALSSAVSPVATVPDKLRLALLRRRLRSVHPAALLRGDDRTTAEALRRAGFSERVIEQLFRPLFGGIQLDPALTTSSRMFDVIFRMLADGDSAVPAAGMQAIPEQLASRLPAGTVEHGVRVTEVAPGRVLTDRGERRGRAVVVACEGPAASDLLGLAPVASKSVGCVYLAADRPPTDDRLIVLNGGPGPVLNVAVMSNVAPSYAPPGSHLVVAALPGVIDGDLAALARATLRSWWGAEVDRWEHLATYRIEHGQPAQPPPLAPRQRTRIEDGLFVCGDHRDTASIQGALYSGRRCAADVIGAPAAVSS